MKISGALDKNRKKQMKLVSDNQNEKIKSNYKIPKNKPGKQEIDEKKETKQTNDDSKGEMKQVGSTGKEKKKVSDSNTSKELNNPLKMDTEGKLQSTKSYQKVNTANDKKNSSAQDKGKIEEVKQKSDNQKEGSKINAARLSDRSGKQDMDVNKEIKQNNDTTKEDVQDRYIYEQMKQKPNNQQEETKINGAELNNSSGKQAMDANEEQKKKTENQKEKKEPNNEKEPENKDKGGRQTNAVVDVSSSDSSSDSDTDSGMLNVCPLSQNNRI